MAGKARLVRVFVGGPDDTGPERQKVVDVLANIVQKSLGERFSLLPFTYDDKFMPTSLNVGSPQGSIDEKCNVREAELVIMLFKGSLGASKPPSDSDSSSASTWELEQAVKSGNARGVLVARLPLSDQTFPPQPSEKATAEAHEAFRTLHNEWLQAQKLKYDLDRYLKNNWEEFDRKCGNLRTSPMDLSNAPHVVSDFVTKALNSWEDIEDEKPTLSYFEGFPYCGLIEFTYEHRMAYFGRSKEVEEVAKRCTGPDAVPLLLVYGPSGVGKSSLLQAGLIQKLEGKGTTLKHLVFEPAGETGQPFRQFATALKNLARGRIRADYVELGEELRQMFELVGDGDAALQQAARAFESRVVTAALDRGGSQSFLPIIVNQMEQLFALVNTERELFLRFVACARYFQRIRLLCSIREDYVGALTRHQHVNAALDARGRSDYLLKPPLRRQMKEMIVEPWASVYGEPGDEFLDFAEEILDDAVEAGDAALPLLSQALFVLHNTCGQDITRLAYERLGRLKGAIAHVADTAIRDIDTKELDALFRCLTSLHGGRWLRETTTKGDLLRAGVSASLVEKLSHRTARLLHIGAGSGGEAVVRLAHDVLFEAWAALSRYTENARSEESERAEVVEDARRWAIDGRRERHLKLRGEHYYRIAARWKADSNLFAGPDRELVGDYVEKAHRLELRRNLIAALNSGWLGEAVDILIEGGTLELQDRGESSAQLRSAFWAAVTGNDRENPDPRNWATQLSPSPDEESIFVRAPKLAVATVTRGWTAGHLAALCGRLPLLRRLIALRPDLATWKSEGGSNLVNAAVIGGDLATVKYLVEELDLPFDEEDDDKNRPIIWALQKKHSAVQAYLKQLGANPHVTTPKGFGTLSEAARSGDVEEVRQALASGFGIDDCTLDGQTALMIAAQSGRVDVVRFLLSCRADPNLPSKFGTTALHAAAWQAQEQPVIVDLLVAAGADRDACDCDDDTPLHLAAAGGKVQLVKSLLAHHARCDSVNSSGFTPLLAAAERGYATVARELLLANADVAVFDKFGWTALHFVAEDGDQTTIHELLLHAPTLAILERPTRDGWTPLMLAARKGHADVARQLIHAGADRSAVHPTGRDVLALAIKSLSIGTVRAILADNSGQPPNPTPNPT